MVERKRNNCCRASARQHTILDTFWFLQSPLDRVFRTIYVLLRSRSCVCLYVCRNSGSIIKLPGCLLNEGGGHKQDFVLRTHRPNAIQGAVLLQRVACSQEVKDFHGCNLLVLRKQIQVSMALFLSTNIHQGDNLFSVQSRGKQCAFMSLSAVLTAQNIPLIDWSQETLDNVLLQGDKMYLHALDNGFFDLESGVELLSVDNLPNIVSISSCMSMFSLICYEICGSMIDTSNINVPVTTAVLELIEAQNQNDLPNVVEPFKAQNNIQLPMVVEPIEAQNKYDLPILVEPIEAQNKYDLPIVVEPSEAQNKNDLPIVVEPIEVQNNIQLPIMVEPIEAQSKRI